MDALVLALVALRTEFRQPQSPAAEPSLKQFDLSALARRNSLEGLGQGLRCSQLRGRFAHETR
jgi:hypothetical protein